MAAAVKIPEHKLSESPNSRAIEIFDWVITARTGPISSATQCEALHASLGIPLPEMAFGDNLLRITHSPSGWTYAFRVEDALRGVKNGPLDDGDGGVKVGYAEAWLKSRTSPDSQIPMPQTVSTKPYDWTFTTTYAGSLENAGSSNAQWIPSEPSNSQHAIPIAELSRPDPILFYAEIPLFEDELHDNGASHLLVRIRVMPTCIFILSRFILRVDNVLFRAHDTRIYHSFASTPPLVVRETRGWEAPYERIKRALPRRNDLIPLTDPNYICKVLSDMPKEASQEVGAGTGWRGLGTAVQITTLQL
ncbi:type 2A phosphatase activator TIP41 [Multifurca ochricompacta]|uniref:Type 2A phosphatase activator TIP41 n=1 Tax=Multifurca ochricompacta TaxID=376703 RepID=A0AAD4QIS2_9AGAM|nr:type 2A phosphatase activator TIP41 [Multifurca ochricompacta]